MKEPPMFIVEPQTGTMSQVLGLREYFAAHAPEPDSQWIPTDPRPRTPQSGGEAEWLEYYRHVAEWSLRTTVEWRYAYADAMVAAAAEDKDEK